MPEFLKIEIDSTDDMPLRKKSLSHSGIPENFQFPGNLGKFWGEGSNKWVTFSLITLFTTYSRLFL